MQCVVNMFRHEAKKTPSVERVECNIVNAEFFRQRLSGDEDFRQNYIISIEHHVYAKVQWH